MNQSRTELRFLDTVKRDHVLPEGSRVIAAVSGGSDSVGMLHLLARFRSHMRWELSVIHVDHATREGTEEESRFVVALAESLGIGSQVERLNPPQGEDESTGEAEMSAARQRIYEIAAGKTSGTLVAVGHTMDDRAETFLLRLAEGSGPRGLGGMSHFGVGPVRRPVLDLSRKELREFLESNGFDWLEDPTNRDPRIARNRVRHELLPVFERIFPGVCARIARSSALLTTWRDFIDSEIESSLEKLNRGSAEAGIRAMDRDSYRQLPEALRLAMLWHFCGRQRFGGEELEKTDRWLLTGGCGEHAMPGGVLLEAGKDVIELRESGQSAGDREEEGRRSRE
jgi:tRNA(Ile)-lysidine synthase